MKNIVLAIVGLAGTGKSELTKLVTTTYEFTPIYFGGCILKELQRRQLEPTSQNERLVREELRANRGMHVIAELSYPEIQSALIQAENVVIDGLYSASEYEYLKNRLSNEFFVLAVHASKKLRYERLASRVVRPLSPEEVDSRDYFEIKNLEKCEPIVLADYHVVNENSIDELAQAIERVMTELTNKRI